MVGSIIFLLLVGAGVVGIVIGVQKNKKKASAAKHEVAYEAVELSLSPVVEVVKVEEKPKAKKATKTAVKKKTTKTK